MHFELDGIGGPTALTMSADINTAQQGEALASSWQARTRAALASQWAAALVFGAMLLVMLLTLMRLPVPFVDEGWNAGRSWALLHTGRPFGTMDSGVFERYPGYWTYFPLIGAAIHAAAIAVLGPTLFTMRLVSFLFGALVLLAVYAAGKRLYDNKVGMIAVVITALSVPFVFISHLGRHDIIMMALGYWAFVLYLSGDPTRVPYRSFLAGLAIGLGLDIHANVVIFAPTIAFLYVLEYGWRVIKSIRFWGYVAGGVVGLLWFLVLHILPFPGTFFALFSLGNGSGRTPPAANPLSLAPSLVDALGRLGPITALLCLVGLAVLLYRRSRSDARLAAFFIVLVLAFAAVVRGKPVFYVGLLVPAAGLLVAALIRKLWTLDWRSARLKLVVNSTVWELAAASALLTIASMIVFRPVEFESVLPEIRAAVPTSATVMGTQTYYFALPDQRYLSWEQLAYYRRDTPGSTLEDAFYAMRPDYLIFDNTLDEILEDEDASTKYFLSLPRDEFDTFVNRYATRITLRGEASGDVLLYRIDWSRYPESLKPRPQANSGGGVATGR
jgi:4-amino-4-deoxy-L-arabinose transferase-like glycosyltransferase